MGEGPRLAIEGYTLVVMAHPMGSQRYNSRDIQLGKPCLSPVSLTHLGGGLTRVYLWGGPDPRHTYQEALRPGPGSMSRTSRFSRRLYWARRGTHLRGATPLVTQTLPCTWWVVVGGGANDRQA